MDRKTGLKAGKGSFVSHLVTHSLALAAAALGAGAMFFMDPVSGRRRRALAEGKGVKAKNRAIRYVGKSARDLRNRAMGVMARLRASGSRLMHKEGTGQERKAA